MDAFGSEAVMGDGAPEFAAGGVFVSFEDGGWGDGSLLVLAT